MKMYAYPDAGKLPVAAIDKALVLKAIEPIWYTKTETASRVRGRIEIGSRFCEDARLSDGRKSGRLGRQPGPCPARPQHNCQGRAPRGAALCRSTRLYGSARSSRGHRREGLGVHDPECAARTGEIIG